MADTKDTLEPESFTLHVKPTWDGGFRFQITDPDLCGSSGQRESLAKVIELLEQHMKSYTERVRRNREEDKKSGY